MGPPRLTEPRSGERLRNCQFRGYVCDANLRYIDQTLIGNTAERHRRRREKGHRNVKPSDSDILVTPWQVQ